MEKLCLAKCFPLPSHYLHTLQSDFWLRQRRAENSSLCQSQVRPGKSTMSSDAYNHFNYTLAQELSSPSLQETCNYEELNTKTSSYFTPPLTETFIPLTSSRIDFCQRTPLVRKCTLSRVSRLYTKQGRPTPHKKYKVFPHPEQWRLHLLEWSHRKSKQIPCRKKKEKSVCQSPKGKSYSVISGVLCLLSQTLPFRKLPLSISSPQTQEFGKATAEFSFSPEVQHKAEHKPSRYTTANALSVKQTLRDWLQLSFQQVKQYFSSRKTRWVK